MLGKSFIDYARRYALRFYFLAAVAALVFAWGYATARLEKFPYDTVENLTATLADWRQYPRHFTRQVPQKFLASADKIERNRIVAHPGRGAFPGQTFVVGFFRDRPGMKLLDMDGRVVHEWHVSFIAIWPHAAHLREKITHDWDSHIHGTLLYPNGDVVFNFEYGGLVRIDKCSRVKWKLPLQTHHSIFEDAAGNLWVPSRKLREKRVKHFADVPAPFVEDYLLKVSPDGRLLQEISVLEAIYGSHEESVLFANGNHKLLVDIPQDRDFTHLNDIEVLSAQMAAAFPMFAAGDVLFSLRNLNLLMVLDPATAKIKWSMTGPYIRQHDPDFMPDGHISVFDNRRDSHRGRTRGGSRILELDPLTRRAITVYGGRADQFFYTGRMGKQQRLPNGNFLVTVSEAGHAFEVTPNGRVVWSFVNSWNRTQVAWVEEATRYPGRYLDLGGSPGC